MKQHPYYVDDLRSSFEQKEVYFRIVIISSILAGIIACVSSYFAVRFNSTIAFVNQNIPFATALIGIPSTIAIYQLLLKSVEKYLWKKRIGSLIGINIPNLEGCWVGEVCLRNRDGEEVRNNSGSLTISQSWSNILISFDTNKSLSFSTCAFIEISAGLVILRYEYEVEKNRGEVEDFQSHCGFAEIYIYDTPSTKTDRLVYYTNHRETGTINITRT